LAPAKAVYEEVLKRQRDFGKGEAKAQPGDKYLQKKISYWESGHERPNASEMPALSQVLDLDLRIVEAWFAR
jgi:hypothetical protein